MYSFFSSLGTLMSHRLGTLMTVLVLGIAMVLPIGLFVTVENLRSLDLKQEQWGAITAFLHTDAEQAEALALARQVDQRADASAHTVSPEAGMEEFRLVSGFGRALDAFDENPLPWVVLVTPELESPQNFDSQVEGIAQWLEQQPEVDLVQVDHKWLQRLDGLLELGDAFISVLAFMFSLAVIVVIANTIRLDVASRAEEIQVLSLVGAGNSFIRQPFLYSGFWYGLLGAFLALILLDLSLFYLQSPLANLLDAYGNSFRIKGLSLPQLGMVLFCGGLLGLLGAWLSVQRHLRLLRSSGRLGRS
jgi:cell division transport system permease protein